MNYLRIQDGSTFSSVYLQIRYVELLQHIVCMLNNCHYFSLSFPSDTRSIPFAVACLVFGFQLLYAMVLCFMSYYGTTDHASKPTANGSERERERSTHNADFFWKFRQHVSGYGGYQIFGFMVARFAGCFALLLLSGISLRACEVDLRSEWKGFLTSCPEIYMVATYVCLA